MGDGVLPPPPVWAPPPSRLTTASSTGRPQTTASSGRRLREFLPSSHSRQSDASFVSSSTIQAERRAEAQQLLLDRQEELRGKVARNDEEHKTKRIELQKVCHSLNLENTRLQKKKGDVERAVQELEKRQNDTTVVRKTFEKANSAQEEQEGVTATSQEWVREAEAAVEAEEETLRSARATLEDLEHIVRRCHDAFLDSDRIKDKELLRARRSREVSEIDRVRYLEVHRLVAPLFEPVKRLKAEYAPLEYAAADTEGRALASRDELENLSKREFDLLQTRDGLLAALPLMREERDQGYIKRDEAKYEYQEAARFIREHHYQRAFFQRTYENTAPSPLDGKIAEAVGNIKDRDYTDTWGEKGIGKHVVKLAIEGIIHKLETTAVDDLERSIRTANRDYEIVHEELLAVRTKNEALLHESQKRRAQADYLVVQIEAAEAQYGEAKNTAEEFRHRAEESAAAMEVQIRLTDDSIVSANRAAEDLSQARMKADLQILRVEEIEEVCLKVQEKAAEARETRDAEERLLLELTSKTQEAQARVEQAVEAEAVARKAREVKQAEWDFQNAKQAKATVKREELQGAVRDAQLIAVKLDEDLRGLQRLHKYDEDMEARQDALARCRIQQSQLSLETMAMRKDVEDAIAAGGKRGTVAEMILGGLDQQIAACGLRVIVGKFDEAQRAKVGGKDLVKTPFLASDACLCFNRVGSVFEKLNKGVTVVRSSPGSRPANMKGWVSQGANVRLLKYSALASRPITEGKHTWSFFVEEFAGKGFLLLGVVRDATAGDAAAVTEERRLGACDATTVRRGSRFEAGTSDTFKLDLNAWALGDCAQSWALSSDGVKVHDGKVTDYTGSSVGASCCVKVSLDLVRQSLAFSLNGQQLGNEMHGVEGPVVPAISVTRSATCRVTLCDYWRA